MTSYFSDDVTVTVRSYKKKGTVIALSKYQQRRNLDKKEIFEKSVLKLVKLPSLAPKCGKVRDI